jgi:hypothetical protein
LCIGVFFHPSDDLVQAAAGHPVQRRHKHD